jgi:hypothetical protein
MIIITFGDYVMKSINYRKSSLILLIFMVVISLSSCSEEIITNCDLEIISVKPSSAKVGDVVAIYGAAIDFNQIIFFGSVSTTPSAFWISHVKQMSVMVPQGAVTGKIYIIYKGKKSNEVDFTVLP